MDLERLSVDMNFRLIIMKTLQYIMGHADISVTLNTYTHVNFDDAKEEVYRIANS